MGHDDAAAATEEGTISVSFFEGHAYVVMRGAVDVETVLRHATIPPIVARDGTSASVDLRGLTFIDSSGLSFLIRLARPFLPRRLRLEHHRHTELGTLVSMMALEELFELVDD
ncbi:STAS domain-containing protein [Cellulomonas marina]|uniref:STAS domain-containing protein n=1 Tax=Cellulomonas marina TaxID=988821 RepID=A0A1I0ZWL4_9CELL|nr:STAS domain-containing protein [Cellulomonas marina]GIG29407.1 hypothetical protein Cma02nite_20070 [Cellulomonas marina]SFB29937.1 STAS domain-containing protein [Cellulomonas marina]